MIWSAHRGVKMNKLQFSSNQVEFISSHMDDDGITLLQSCFIYVVQCTYTLYAGYRVYRRIDIHQSSRQGKQCLAMQLKCGLPSAPSLFFHFPCITVTLLLYTTNLFSILPSTAVKCRQQSVSQAFLFNFIILI